MVITKGKGSRGEGKEDKGRINGAKLVLDAANNTNEGAGDSSSTATVLAYYWETLRRLVKVLIQWNSAEV